MHNINIPSFKALIRKSWLTKSESDRHIYDNCYVFGIQSVPGKILTFHIMTDYGAMRSRVPLSEIFMFEPVLDIEPHFKQLWNCFSENVSVCKLDYLDLLKCIVKLRDKSSVWATYLFTVDWFNNPYSDEPTDYKCAHILVSDDGYLLAQPNNRIFWKDSSWITKPIPEDIKLHKVDDTFLNVETVSDKWVSEDGESFYYDIKTTK